MLPAPSQHWMKAARLTKTLHELIGTHPTISCRLPNETGWRWKSQHQHCASDFHDKQLPGIATSHLIWACFGVFFPRQLDRVRFSRPSTSYSRGPTPHPRTRTLSVVASGLCVLAVNAPSQLDCPVIWLVLTLIVGFRYRSIRRVRQFSYLTLSLPSAQCPPRGVILSRFLPPFPSRSFSTRCRSSSAICCRMS